MPDGRPHHPDHRLHGQVVPWKDVLLHRACLHGETLRMIKMVVKVMMIVVEVAKMTKYTQHCPNVFAGSVSIHINVQHDCHCSGQVFYQFILKFCYGNYALYATKSIILFVCM